MLPAMYARDIPPENKDEFLAQAQKYDFLNVIFTDLNGVRREKIIPADRAKSLLKGDSSVICILALAYNGMPLEIQDHIDYNFGNINILPILNTLRSWPSSDQAEGTRSGQVLCSAHWRDNSPLVPDSRAMAVRQMERLKERGLNMLMGTEAEFRLFQPPSNPDEELKPSHSSLNLFLPRTHRQYFKFYSEMSRRMQSIGFQFESFHSEFGKGQLEFAMKPEWGILAADNLVRFKMLVDETALDNGYLSSFMTKPLIGETGNGFHLNHSIWRQNDAKSPTENVMLDDKDPQKLSAFARHWIAGQLHHGRALTAITSPTVNCYRRLHCPWAPGMNDWAIDNRFAALRAKNGGNARDTYVENRNPSSACNPYLVLAGVIAAGLDGVDRKLELPAERSKDLGELPRTLQEAVEALQKDKQLGEALGIQFVEWYAALKMKEVEELKAVSFPNGTPEDFKKERAVYFDTA